MRLRSSIGASRASSHAGEAIGAAQQSDAERPPHKISGWRVPVQVGLGPARPSRSTIPADRDLEALHALLSDNAVSHKRRVILFASVEDSPASDMAKRLAYFSCAAGKKVLFAQASLRCDAATTAADGSGIGGLAVVNSGVEGLDLLEPGWDSGFDVLGGLTRRLRPSSVHYDMILIDGRVLPLEALGPMAAGCDAAVLFAVRDQSRMQLVETSAKRVQQAGSEVAAIVLL